MMIGALADGRDAMVTLKIYFLALIVTTTVNVYDGLRKPNGNSLRRDNT